MKVLNSAEMKERLVRIGADSMPMTPEQFDAYTRDELEVNAKIVAAEDITPQ